MYREKVCHKAVDVIAGESDYPSVEEIIQSVKALVEEAWFIDATEEAMKLGNPIFSNIIMLGALGATGVVPMDKETFKEVLSESMPDDRVAMNLNAYDIGAGMIRNQG